MKILKVRAHALEAHLGGRAFAYSQAWYNSRMATIVEIECDDGTVGYGECFGPAPILSVIVSRVYAPLLKGLDPMNREWIWNYLYNALRDNGQKGTTIEALSGVDIALWDIAGKALGVPIYQLAGRKFRDHVQKYATCLYRKTIEQDTAKLIAEVEEQIHAGFSAIKLKIGFGVRADIELVKNVRRAVGDDIRLMIDANHAYDVSQSVKIARALADCNIDWFEEPIVPEDIDGYRLLREKTEIPIAAGEAEFTRYGFMRLVASSAVDILQPDCCITGGLTEALKIVDLGNAAHIRVNPHVWGTGIALAAGIHLCAMIAPSPPALVPENEPMLEVDRSPNPLRDDIVVDGLDLNAERTPVPHGPGLGVEIDQKALSYYSTEVL